MAGFGNRTAPDLTHDTADHLAEDHKSTRLARDDSHPYSNPHDTYGSGATGGAGFGNKSAPDPDQLDNSEFRFGSHKNTDVYSGGTRHGSGSTAGAGFGNKTGAFEASNDSTVGKLMEKAGHMMHKETLVEKGRAKREGAGFGVDTGKDREDFDGPTAN